MNARLGIATRLTPCRKTHITIRIDHDVLEWLRERVHEAGDGNWRTTIRQALRDCVEREAEPLEATRRLVLERVLPASRAAKSREPRSDARHKPAARKKRPGTRGRRKK